MHRDSNSLMNMATALFAGSAYSPASGTTHQQSLNEYNSRPATMPTSHSTIDSGMNMALRTRAARVTPCGSNSDIRPRVSL